MDGIIREVNARVLGKGLRLRLRLLDQRGNNWKVNQLLYADDTMLLGYSKENIQRLLNEFDNVCERRILKMNVGKSKMLVCGKSRREGHLNLKREVLKDIDAFKYLVVIVSKNGGLNMC